MRGYEGPVALTLSSLCTHALEHIPLSHPSPVHSPSMCREAQSCFPKTAEGKNFVNDAACFCAEWPVSHAVIRIGSLLLWAQHILWCCSSRAQTLSPPADCMFYCTVVLSLNWPARYQPWISHKIALIWSASPYVSVIKWMNCFM